MQRFILARPTTIEAALSAGTAPEAAYIAGGTDLLQLMKQEVARPTRLVELDGLLPDGITVEPDGLMIGAGARMADVAGHPVVRQGYRAIAEALVSAASPQIRNMGTIGGNLLQRTRCNYFRDPGFAACNKREPGSGCAALEGGEDRLLGVFGTGPACIATHPSDLPVALAALDAEIELSGAHARRRVAIADFYRLPGETPHIETTLEPGELITAIRVKAGAAARGSRYLKIRDRASFEFALVSCAAALVVEDGAIREARLALGGVAPRPWRLGAVEAALRGRPANRETFAEAARHAAEGARPARQNAFKVALATRAVQRTLEIAAS